MSLRTVYCGTGRILFNCKLRTVQRIQLCSVFNETGVWEKFISLELKRETEKYWIERSAREDEQNVKKISDKKKFYVLSMFPYPSGKLHMGHLRIYTVSDVMARFYRMRGMKVIHPMGWDAFGLPAENAAIEKGEAPEKWTYSNITHMKEQLKKFGCRFDWDRELATCDPKYYKWTQVIFLKMLESGLVYRKQAMVNWDPVDQTVLADEQVDAKGCSWRSGAKVERRPLTQWFVRTTRYSQQLMEGLDDPGLVNWNDIIQIQKAWIGECNGYHVHFKLQQGDRTLDQIVTVWTDRPEDLNSTELILLSPAHLLNQLGYHQDNTQPEYLLDIQAVHPLTNQALPLVVTSTREMPQFIDSMIGCPKLNHEDQSLCQRLGLETLDASVHSEFTDPETARTRITDKLKAVNAGGYKASQRLRDWLISRQRYWGTPIPVIHCGKCDIVPVPLEDLPVILPPVHSLIFKGQSPLQQATDWINVKCPRCGGDSKRETDTMDTFVDSSWYYLRYLDPQNMSQPVGKEAGESMPVDLYVGGREHAALHLYYARFMNHFLHSLGWIRTPEPFSRLLMQGYIKGVTYVEQKTGRYLHRSEVDLTDEKHPLSKSTKLPVITRWEKMSKSKHNGLDPQEVLDKYGVDTTRLLMIANCSPQTERKWDTSDLGGIERMQHVLWLTVGQLISTRAKGSVDKKEKSQGELDKYEQVLKEARNNAVQQITDYYMRTYKLPQVVIALHTLLNKIRTAPLQLVLSGPQYEQAVADVLLLYNPIMPHLAAELWDGFRSAQNRINNCPQWDAPISEQAWPQVDMDTPLRLFIMVNRKLKGFLHLPRRELDFLTAEQSLQLILEKSDIRLGRVVRTQFRLEPGVHAEISLVSEEIGDEVRKEEERDVRVG